MSDDLYNAEGRRSQLFRAQNRRCHWCAAECTMPRKSRDGFARPATRFTFTIDHVLPRCRGGSNHPTNLVGACQRCNNRRASMEHKLLAGKEPYIHDCDPGDWKRYLPVDIIGPRLQDGSF